MIHLLIGWRCNGSPHGDWTTSDRLHKYSRCSHTLCYRFCIAKLRPSGPGRNGVNGPLVLELVIAKESVVGLITVVAWEAIWFYPCV